MPVCENAVVIENKEISKNIFYMKLRTPSIAKDIKPGQFVNIKCSNGYDAFLRRPISVLFAEGETIELVYQMKGKGTTLLSKFLVGSDVSLVGPLGKGFDTTVTGKKIAVIGGGIGIFPLYFLLTRLQNCEKFSFIGFRNKESIILEKEFVSASSLFTITTDDGSFGLHGFVTEPFEKRLLEGLDQVYTCGPLQMIEKVAKMCIAHNVKCQVSMEQRMGCGVGACAVCVCKGKSNNQDKWEYLKVCKNGPVFEATQLIFE